MRLDPLSQFRRHNAVYLLCLLGAKMTARRWLMLTLLFVLSVSGASAVLAWMIDPYGLLRDPTGRKLGIHFAERKAKFLMSRRYVPANFDGLIVGPSSSANWSVDQLAGARMFNESIDGANAAEEQLIAGQALTRGNFKLAVFIIHPILTASHDVKEGLDHANETEALGSIHLFVNEIANILQAAHVRFRTSDAAPNGQLVFNTRTDLTPIPFKPEVLRMDQTALAQYRDLINSFQMRGAKVIYVIPPIYEPCYALDRQALQNYLQSAEAVLPPAPIIDLNAPEFSSFRASSENYIDCVHLQAQGASRIVALLKSAVVNTSPKLGYTDLLRDSNADRRADIIPKDAYN
jgi:hypothetical protein